MSDAANVIREAGAGDAPGLARLRYEFRASLEPPREGEAAFVRRCQAWMEPRLAEGSAWRCWVIERGGEILGQAWLELVERIPNPSGEPENHAYLTNVYIRPAARRQGLGSRLLAAALGWCACQGVDSVILWPTPESRPLYARFGFRDSGEVWESRGPGSGSGVVARATGS